MDEQRVYIGKYDYLDANFDYMNIPQHEAYTAYVTGYSINLPYYAGSLGINCQGPHYYTHRKGLNELFLCYTIEGHGILKYRDSTYHLAPGDLFLIDCLHEQYYATAPDDTWKFLWIHFGGQASHPFFDLIFKEGFRTFKVNNNDFIFKAYNELVPLVKNHMIINDYRICHLLQEIMIFIASYSKLNTQNIYVPEWLNRVLQYIYEHYNEDISREGLEEIANYSYRHITREFNKHVGYAPHEYIIIQRLNRSCDMLKYSNDTIEQICFKINFSTCGHYIAKFKEVYGITPQAYRKLHISGSGK